MLSKTCIYGLRASLFLARHETTGYVHIREISEELDISFHFLAKVLQQLTNAEILDSYKGPNGGVKLGKPASEITFMDILHAINEDLTISECILGLAECGELAPCPLYNQWTDMRKSLWDFLNQTALSDLVKNENKITSSFSQRTNQPIKNHLITR